jgi:hypothetical protein
MSYEIVGYEMVGEDIGGDYDDPELVAGDDVDDLLSGYDIVGARRRAPARRGAPVRRGAMRPVVRPTSPVPRHGTLLKETEPTKDGQLLLPMSSSGTVAAATAATITARPQVKAFRPQRIVVGNSIAAFFTISDIKVGNKSQFVQAGVIPAEAFVQGAFGVAMRQDTVQTAQDYVFQVNNIDAMARSFLCVVFGRSVD